MMLLHDFMLQAEKERKKERKRERERKIEATAAVFDVLFMAPECEEIK